MKPLAVTAMGMVTSVGRSYVSSCASIRAGLTAPRPIKYFSLLDDEDQAPIPLTGYPVHAFTEGFTGLGRWVRLALGALDDMLSSGALPDRTDDRFWSRTGLICLIPPQDPDRFLDADALGQETMRQGHRDVLLEEARLPLHLDELYVIDKGHAGAAMALALAETKISARAVDRMVIVAADSYLDELSLEGLAEADRLKTDLRPDGLMPGEAGACVIVESLASAERRRIKPLAQVVAAATDAEASPVGGDKPRSGAALSRALRAVITAAGPVFAGDLVIDLNGEPWRASEWAIARVRLSHLLDDEIRLVMPCSSLGDTGAASGIIGLAVAARSFERGYATGVYTLVVSSSEGGDAGAFLVRHDVGTTKVSRDVLAGIAPKRGG